MPCWNRRADAIRLLADLAALTPTPGACLRVTLVDNASDQPLSTLQPPAGLRLDHLRLERNAGGSGGFNAGLAHALAQTGPGTDHRTLLWLIDSDVRPEPGALGALLDAMHAHPDALVVGSMLCHPDSGLPFELGGHVDRRRGEYVSHRPTQTQLAAPNNPVQVEYVAACSMIVRAGAARRAGLMADLFVNGDDVEWCLRLARVNSGRILASPASRVRHPHPDRMRTWDRAYVGRNAFAVIDALGLDARTRFRRAAREVARALCQTLVGRDDLAGLHLAALESARRGRVNGPMRASFRPFAPLERLPEELANALSLERHPAVEVIGELGLDQPTRADLVRRLERAGLRVISRPAHTGPLAALSRLLSGPSTSVALVSARARPADWMAGRTLVTVCPQGFSMNRIRHADRIAAAVGVAARGLRHSAALAVRGPGARPTIAWPPPPPGTPDLAIIVLSYNRAAVLVRTITALLNDPALDPTVRDVQILVVDNGSTDGSVEFVRRRCPDPRVNILPLDSNIGVAAFNRGVAMTDAPLVLILDDDARPVEGALAEALRVLDARPELAAVTLHPKHPASRASEWPFAGDRPRDDWPVMGCANLVRRDAWRRVHGYEERFFLYRNDIDLAMKLRAIGMGVYFDPDQIVWHDSPAARRKSPRWFSTATRNWVWLCRRHGRGLTTPTAIAAGWLRAHRLAGVSPGAHVRTVGGVLMGLCAAPPTMPADADRSGRVLRDFLTLRFRAAR